MIALDTNVLLALLDFKKDFLEILWLEGYRDFVIFDFILEELKKVAKEKYKSLINYYFKKYKIKIEKCNLNIKDVDIKLIYCCKIKNYILVTFDRKLIYRANQYNVKIITFSNDEIRKYGF